MKKHIITLLMILTAIIASLPAQASPTFTDITPNSWYSSAISYVLENNYMTGIDSETFAPNLPVTRGMLVTVLHRIEGTPNAKANTKFSDVKSDAYYSTPISWAAENKIVTGYSAAAFGPNDNVTREQLATILYRYATVKGYNTSNTTDLSGFSDVTQISAYAKEAMQWANALGLISGTSATTLSPKSTATRAQLATIIMRFEKAVFSTEINSGGEKSTITVTGVTAHAGDTDVDVVVSIKNNPGILGMSLNLTYDESAMTLKSASNGSVLKNSLTMTKSKTLSSGCNFIWDGLEVQSSDISDGEILVLTFSIKDTATPKSYPVTISYKSGGIVNNSLAPVDVDIVNGSINVIG